MKFSAMIVGGIGDDVWDEDLEIDAADFEDAAEQANGKAESRGGRVYLLEEIYGDRNPVRDLHRRNTQLECKNTQLHRTLTELYDAMVSYEGDVDGEAPSKHHLMMERVRHALSTEEDHE